MIPKKKKKKPRFAFLQGYGTDDHVDYYTVAIQSGGVIDGGKVLDHAFFWTKDHADMDEFTDAIMQYLKNWKVKEVRYVPVILPWTYCDKCDCGALTFMVYDYDDLFGLTGNAVRIGVRRLDKDLVVMVVAPTGSLQTAQISTCEIQQDHLVIINNDHEEWRAIAAKP